MSLRRTLLSLVALSVVVGLLPTSGAQAAVNRAPKIKKAVMKDRNGDGMADRVVLTYNERIKHKVDRRRFPFKVAGYRIKKINGAKGTRRLVILLRQNADAPLKPASISYKKTRQQPVTDMKGKQARKQMLTKNIVGLLATPPTGFILTVERGGDGTGTVTSSPAGIDCGTSCEAEFEPDTAVTLTAVPRDGETFVGWTGCATMPTPETCTVTMDAPKTVGATFGAAGSRSLTVAHAGAGTGTVTSNPAGIDCGSTCTGSFPEDTAVVSLTAAPDDASKFMGWGGDATCPASSLTCNVVMDGNKNVTVTFDLLPVYTLTVTPSGPAGSGQVTSISDKSSTDQINCGSDCTGTYSEGTKVTLTAVPATGFDFDGWSGGATCATETCEVPMDADKTVTATFVAEGTEPVMHALAITKVGDGEVNCAVELNPVACNDAFEAGTVVMITATPTVGVSATAQLSGDCTSEVLPVATCNVTMNAPKTVTATFAPLGLPIAGGTQP